MTKTASMIEITRRMTIPRDARASAVKMTDKQSGAIAYFYDLRGRPMVSMFAPKGCKPVAFHAFRSATAREGFVAGMFERYRERARRVAADRAERSKPHTIEVGHVFVAAWGCEQTNVSWWQVTRLIGKNSVGLRPIAAVNVEDLTWASGRCIPALDQFKGAEVVKRVSGDRIRFESYMIAHLWDGRPKYWSSYA